MNEMKLCLLYQTHIAEQFTKYPRIFISHPERADKTTYIYFLLLNKIVGVKNEALYLIPYYRARQMEYSQKCCY